MPSCLQYLVMSLQQIEYQDVSNVGFLLHADVNPLTKQSVIFNYIAGDLPSRL